MKTTTNVRVTHDVERNDGYPLPRRSTVEIRIVAEHAAGQPHVGAITAALEGARKVVGDTLAKVPR